MTTRRRNKDVASQSLTLDAPRTQFSISNLNGVSRKMRDFNAILERILETQSQEAIQDARRFVRLLIERP